LRRVVPWISCEFLLRSTFVTYGGYVFSSTSVGTHSKALIEMSSEMASKELPSVAHPPEEHERSVSDGDIEAEKKRRKTRRRRANKNRFKPYHSLSPEEKMALDAAETARSERRTRERMDWMKIPRLDDNTCGLQYYSQAWPMENLWLPVTPLSFYWKIGKRELNKDWRLS
ncbi:hypothetical protein OESDEN_00580, partial [Oesophagostomum dentatum]